MSEILVLAEHRQGEIRDITFELLSKGRELADATGSTLVCALLGSDVGSMAETLKGHANSVLYVDDRRLEHFNAESYQVVLRAMLADRLPSLTLIGHTAFGVDLAPALAQDLGFPLATDCVDFTFEAGNPMATRQIYGGKLNQHVSFGSASNLMATLRAGVFTASDGTLRGEIQRVDRPPLDEIDYRRFLQYVEAAKGEVDITQASVVIGVGRGIKEQENLALLEGLARSLGGVLACSRPVVDAGWLPKDRQIGSSGRTIKAKLYIAVGISGAFQHVAGIRNSETIVAINKDPSAPIFGEADYGIVADLFKAVPALTQRITEMKD